jgi:hypothetical protein
MAAAMDEHGALEAHHLDAVLVDAAGGDGVPCGWSSYTNCWMSKNSKWRHFSMRSSALAVRLMPDSTRPGSPSRDGIGQRLGTEGLIARIDDVQADAFQELQRGDTDLGCESVDEEGDEKADAHGQPLSSGLMSGKSCP